MQFASGDCRLPSTLLSENAAWSANGPRKGATLKHSLTSGWVLYGGLDAAGKVMTDVWYTSAGTPNYGWIAGAPLPIPCVDVPGNAYLFTPFTAAEAVFIYCPSITVGVASSSLWSFTAGVWSAAGTVAQLSGVGLMNRSQIAAVRAPSASVDAPRVAARTDSADVGRISSKYCFAAVRDDGAVYITLDGLTWRNTGGLAPGPAGSWPRVGYSVFPLWPGVGVLGGRASLASNDYYDDLWVSSPQLCCATGYDALSASYVVCSGHGACTGGGGMTNACECSAGWSGDWCDVAVPSPSPSPSASGGPTSSGGGGLSTTQLAALIIVPLGLLAVGAAMALVMRSKRGGRSRTIRPSGGGQAVTVSHPYTSLGADT